MYNPQGLRNQLSCWLPRTFTQYPTDAVVTAYLARKFPPVVRRIVKAAA